MANALPHGGGPRQLTVDVMPGGVTVPVSDGSPTPTLPRDQCSTADGLPEKIAG